MTTTIEKKPRITKANRFTDIKALLTGEPTTYGTTVDVALEVLDKELDALARKSSSNNKKPTTAQKAMEQYKALMLDFMETVGEEGVSCAEAYKAVPQLAEDGFQIQKAASILTKLKEDGMVYSMKVKGKPMYFYGTAPVTEAE